MTADPRTAAPRTAAPKTADGRAFKCVAAGVLISLLCSGFLLDSVYNYATPGGSPFLKIHPGSYLLLGSLLVFAAGRGPIAFIAAQAQHQLWALQFFMTTALIALVGLVKFGPSGLAYMVDALIVPPAAIMLLHSVAPERRLWLTKLLLTVIFVNSLTALAEAALKVHFLHAEALEGAEFFRATAFFGHPLANALITAPMLPLLFAVDWPARQKLAFSSAYIVSLLAFGARGGFSLGLLFFASGLLLSGAVLVARRRMRLSTLLLVTLFVLLVGCAVLGVLLFGTPLGDRIVQKAYMDESAETRVQIFQIFTYLTFDQLWEGISPAQLKLMTEKYESLEYLENFWLIMLVNMGLPLFALFVASLAWFAWALRRAQHVLLNFAVLSFFTVASTNNSLSTKTPALTVFSIVAYGLRREARLDIGRTQRWNTRMVRQRQA